MELVNDFTTSVRKAFSEIYPDWERYPGLVVCGTHNPNDVEATIEKIGKAREDRTPFLGICMGFQLMLVEWVRHKGWKDANTAEVDPNTTTKVIARLPEMRVGIRPVYWRGKETQESHWHHYGFARKFTDRFEKEWELSWTDGILEIAKLRDHPFFMGTQFHPEYQSTKENKHPILQEFLSLCRK